VGSTPNNRQRKGQEVIRRAVLAVLGIVAIVMFVGPLVVGKADTDRYNELIVEAIADNAVNDSNAESAPQQQVVNGWVARDLLLLQARQQNDALELQYRQMALTLVTALILGWGFMTLRDQRKQEKEPAPQLAPVLASDATVATVT
jgi:hypothetical protein